MIATRRGTAARLLVIAAVAAMLATNVGGAQAAPVWSQQSVASPAGLVEHAFFGVSCPTTSACTAVGYSTNGSNIDVTLAEKWDGRSWVVQPTPDPLRAKGSSLAAVSCAVATVCTAVGSYSNSSNVLRPLVEHWNGTSWTGQSFPTMAGWTAARLSGVSCPTAKRCVAVGDFTDGSNHHRELIGVWNGTSWALQPLPALPPNQTAHVLTAVSCTAAAACTAVGYLTDIADTDGAIVWRWNGSSWSQQFVPLPVGSTATVLTGVSCTSASVCEAVGLVTEEANPGPFGFAERWSSGSWAVQSIPKPTGATSSRLFGVSCASSTNCAAVGSFSNSSTTNIALIERWNGSSWKRQASAHLAGITDSFLDGVSCTTATACTAVGGTRNASNVDRLLAERYA